MDKGAEVIHNSEEIRSFIAIELPEEVKNALTKLRGGLERTEHSFIKWVDPGGIHLTLKFLGNVPFKQVTQITRAVEEATKGIPHFHLEISSLGAFPNLKQPRVLWVGIGGEIDRLLRLQQNIDSALAPMGFAKEERPFTPHLTLARMRQGASSIHVKNFGELLMSTNFETRCSFKVGAVNLIKSQLTPRGAVYTCLSATELETQKT